MQRNVLFVADSSSQLRPAHAIAAALARDAGFAVVGNLLPGKSTPTRQQVAEIQLDCPLTFHTVDVLFSTGRVLDFDAVVVLLPGSKLFDFRRRMEELIFRRKPVRRPILVTGYNGVVYEKHLEGLLWRIGFDLIAVNSANDHAVFSRHLDALGMDSRVLVRTGLLLAQASDHRPLITYGEGPRDILFATQAVVPRTRAERAYLLTRLRQLAEIQPDRLVIIKPRTRPHEQTFHVEKHHYETLYVDLFGAERPSNLVFAYGALSPFLQRVGLLVTVSSTALLEGLAYGVPGVALTDLGVKESLGNHFFALSGMLASFDDVLDGRVPHPSPEWLRLNGFAEQDRIGALVQHAQTLLEYQEELGYFLPLQAAYYTPRRARFIYESSLPLRQAWETSRPMNGSSKRKKNKNGTSTLRRKVAKLRHSPSRFFVDAIRNRLTRLD